MPVPMLRLADTIAAGRGLAGAPATAGVGVRVVALGDKPDGFDHILSQWMEVK